jgi:predicted SAM-dependent methyltransferase
MLVKLIRRYTTRGLRSTLQNAATEFRVNLTHQNGKRRVNAYRGVKGLRIHFGCGSTIKAEWINVDLDPHADVKLDLREPLPFEDGSAALIYSEHFLEHLSYPDEAVRWTSECARVLQAEGIFSVGVPDAEWPIRAYTGDPEYAGWFDYVRSIYPEGKTKTRMELINHSFRQWAEHKMAYDFETLAQLLSTAGLGNVRRREWTKGLDSEKSRFSLNADGSKCTTLYAEATKPTAGV